MQLYRGQERSRPLRAVEKSIERQLEKLQLRWLSLMFLTLCSAPPASPAPSTLLCSAPQGHRLGLWKNENLGVGEEESECLALHSRTDRRTTAPPPRGGQQVGRTIWSITVLGMDLGIPTAVVSHHRPHLQTQSTTSLKRSGSEHWKAMLGVCT